MSDERPLNEYIDLEAYDVVTGEKYRSLAAELNTLARHGDNAVRGRIQEQHRAEAAEAELKEESAAKWSARKRVQEAEAELERVKHETHVQDKTIARLGRDLERVKAERDAAALELVRLIPKLERALSALREIADNPVVFAASVARRCLAEIEGERTDAPPIGDLPWSGPTSTGKPQYRVLPNQPTAEMEGQS